MTRSEEVFERFCGQNNLDFERLGEGPETSPDYRLSLSGTSVFVEVKQIEANPDEKALLQTPLDQWDPANAYHWGIPGDRIRKKITIAVPQLKARGRKRHPTLLVILNMVNFWPELADEYAVQVAMYGIETALISNEVAPEGGAKILARWHANRKRITRTVNTSLSGVGLLSDNPTRVTLTIYHNFYAAVPLPVAHLANLGTRQFVMLSDPVAAFAKWREIKPENSS